MAAAADINNSSSSSHSSKVGILLRIQLLVVLTGRSFLETEPTIFHCDYSRLKFGFVDSFPCICE